MSHRKTHYLDFYKKYMQSARLPVAGLCSCFSKNDDLSFVLGGENMGHYSAFNGSRIITSDCDNVLASRLHYEFTPLRQTIVLFMAAMNNEL